jgi:aldos-2-ulose dehydratase/isomerase family protein/VCBS repeat protein
MIFDSFYIIRLALLYFFTNPPQVRFEAQIIDNNISIGYGLALGDVDGDRKPDILLADKKQFVWYRNGDWKRFVMIDSLTKHDNVCIAARDINGDGKVEVAVGAQWNPGETSNAAESGSVHYLIRPADPTQLWKAIELHHEPTVHRMQWVKLSRDKYSLVVVPLHGRGNKGGEGEGVRVLAYHFPKNVNRKWQVDTLEKTMHLTHNFDIIEDKDAAKIYLAGKEGIIIINDGLNNSPEKSKKDPRMERGTGEVRVGKIKPDKIFITTIEPMHGDAVVVYLNDKLERVLLDDNIKEGHALAVADLLNAGSDQVIAGWRIPNKDGKVGIKLYAKKNSEGTEWESYWVDENGMACEDLKIGDLNGDGKPDIVASGRSTHNLKIYWNK